MPHVPCRACGLPLCFLKSCASDTAKGAGVLRTGAPAPFCCDAARAAPGHELSGSLRKQAGVSRLQIVLQEGLAPGEAVGIGRHNGHHAAFGPVACAVVDTMGIAAVLHVLDNPGGTLLGVFGHPGAGGSKTGSRLIGKHLRRKGHGRDGHGDGDHARLASQADDQGTRLGAHGLVPVLGDIDGEVFVPEFLGLNRSSQTHKSQKDKAKRSEFLHGKPRTVPGW